MAPKARPGAMHVAVTLFIVVNLAWAARCSQGDGDLLGAWPTTPDDRLAHGAAMTRDAVLGPRRVLQRRRGFDDDYGEANSHQGSAGEAAGGDGPGRHPEGSDSVLAGVVGVLLIVAGVVYALHRTSQARVGQEKREGEEYWHDGSAVYGAGNAGGGQYYQSVRRRGAMDPAPPPYAGTPPQLYVHHKRRFLGHNGPLVHKGEPLLSATDRVPRTDFEIPFKELTTSVMIGQGAFGRVFKGRWRGTPVAVKMLVCQELNQDVVKEFRDEVAVLSALRHPNIILFMGACTVSPHLCIVTELAPRGSLWGVLHGGGRKLHWRTVLKMIVDTARGMAFLHSAKPSILHRDLKSGNLLVDEAYSIKLSDFGLARVKAYTATMTGNCGTFQWMAPEVLANARYTEKADVYSFGVVCWELFTSKCPYETLNQIQVAIAVLNEGKRLEIPDSTPADVAELVRSCWHADPAARPSFLEILEKLESNVALTS